MRRYPVRVITLLTLCAVPVFLQAQGGRGGAPQSEVMRQASLALREGRTADALAAVRKEAETNPASTAAANMLAQRAMAMSYAFGSSASRGW